MIRDAFSPAELRLLCRLDTPEKIQGFLDERIEYNRKASARSPRRVLQERRGHCMEGALFAAAAFEANGHPPLVVDLASVRDDDHVIAVFRQNGLWGAVAKSNYSGLRYRTPIYRSIRELALSYWEHYFNTRGEKTLRSYTRPILLSPLDPWRTPMEHVWHVADRLIDAPHIPLLPRNVLYRRYHMDRRLKLAGCVGKI
jgi:hypothetical protein